MYKRVGTIMLGIAAAVTIGACSPPHEHPSDQPPGAEQHPTTLPGAPAPVEIVPGESGAANASGSSSATPSGQLTECTADDVDVAGSFGSKPDVTIPQDCAAPGTLLDGQLKEGSGPEATAGSTLEVHYQTVLWSNGEVVDGNFGSGGTRQVRDLGKANVIAGWNEGLVGLKEGGRRLLVVPPEKAYGNEGTGEIGPDATLVSVIDAVSVQPQ